jgi:hypothetical protein
MPQESGIDAAGADSRCKWWGRIGCQCGTIVACLPRHTPHMAGTPTVRATADGIVFMVERDVAVGTGQIEDVEAVIAVWREPKVTSKVDSHPLRLCQISA